MNVGSEISHKCVDGLIFTQIFVITSFALSCDLRIFIISCPISSPRNGHVGTRNNNDSGEDEPVDTFATNFRTVVHRSPPQCPSNLLRKLEMSSQELSVGKIRVILRVAKGQSLACSPDGEVQGNQIFQLDRRRKQLTMYDPSVIRSGLNPNGK